MKNISWCYRPTILSYEPNLTKQMATFLGCSGTGDGSDSGLFGAAT